MTRWATFLLAAATLSGCVQAEELQERILPGREPVPERWEASVEPSMAPDFSGTGPSYPVLLVHQHHVPSARQQEEARRNPVVCLRLDGSPLAFAPSTRDMAACAGPAADPPTGRAFVERESYLAQGGRGLAVMMDPCRGGAIVLGRDGFLVQAPGHAFEVRLLENGTFRVDGRWLAPGSSLKVGYFLHAGDAQDEEYVRVVFDAPGRWLLSRMGSDGRDLDGVPPRPDHGSGLFVDVDVAPVDLASPLRAVLDATPGAVRGVASLRAVHDGERLTELTVRVLAEDEAILWYGAGRVEGKLRLLGARDPLARDEPQVGPEALLDLAASPWDTLRAGTAPTTDVRLDPTTSWGTVAGIPLGVDRSLAPGGCEGGCVFVRQAGAWSRVVLPERGEAMDALTLQVLSGEGRAANAVWWHVPAAPAP